MVRSDNGSALNTAAIFSIPSSSCDGAAAHLGPKALVFGQSVPLTGLLLGGSQAFEGIMAAFAVQNAMGGINNHRLHFVSLDDGYVPAIATANTKALIQQA